MQIAVLGAGKSSTQREAEADSRGIAGRGFGAAGERGEQACAGIGGQARSVVGQGQDQGDAAGGSGDAKSVRRLAVFAGVVGEVGEDALNGVRVSADAPRSTRPALRSTHPPASTRLPAPTGR